MGASQQALLTAISAASGTTMTWNSADKNAGITLSNGDRTATTSSASQSVRGTAGKSSGKWYFEVLVSATGSSFMTTGVLDSGGTLADYVGSTANSAGLGTLGFTYSGGASFGTNTLQAADIIGVAFDASTGKIWFAINNVWIGSGDPAGDANPRYTLSTGVTYFAATSPRDSNNTIQATFTYAPPSGFSPWG